ncbi:MAG: ATP-binding cassette domain-containing protein [Planctomycetota bacterium]|nr:ATP-binding cassette domain-containing protein [Planctomycetota bacterium]
MGKPMKKILWKLDDVQVAGTGQPRLAVTGLEIPAGVTAILGPSGAGKTTLLNLLAGFERPAAGTVVSYLAVTPGELPLFWGPPGDGLWPSETVVEHLRRVAPSGTPPGEAERLLELFGLKDKSDVRPDLLSQGECSRLSLARALASQARVLVLDEPLVHVEPARLLPYWDVLHAERPAGGSLVFSTHEPELVLRSAQHVICLAEGNVVFSGSAEQLERDPPSEALAWYLGAANWIPARESPLWLGHSSADDRCVRPHDLQAEVASDGPLLIETVRRSRGLNELDARHEPTGERRRFFLSRLAQELQTGVRVRFSVLGLLLALCLTLSGCGGATAGSDQTLTEVGYWMLPSEGIRIPAPRAVHAAGDDLYILDNVGRVLVYDGEGELKKQWWMPEYSVGRPEKICLLPDGRLAVADTHYHRVILFDQEGTEVGRFSSCDGVRRRGEPLRLRVWRQRPHPEILPRRSIPVVDRWIRDRTGSIPASQRDGLSWRPVVCGRRVQQSHPGLFHGWRVCGDSGSRLGSRFARTQLPLRHRPQSRRRIVCRRVWRGAGVAIGPQGPAAGAFRS